MIVSRGTIASSLFGKSCKTILKKRVFHVEQKIALSVVLIGLVIWDPIFPKANADILLFLQSLRERGIYETVAFSIVHNHSFMGISCGQLVVFVSQRQTYPLICLAVAVEAYLFCLSGQRLK